MDTNQFGVILEDIREMFRTLGDGQKAIAERMDRLENRMDKLENRMDKLENRMDKLEDRMDNLEWHQGQVEDALRKVIKQLASSENEFERQLKDHEGRISRLEAKVGIG